MLPECSTDPRVIAAPGVRNLRAVGAYATEDSGRIRPGLLYRSGHSGDVTPAGHAKLVALGFRTIVDLRTTDERARHPFAASLTDRLVYWTRDYALGHGAVEAMLRDASTSAEAMAARVTASYRAIAYEQRAGIAAVIAALASGVTPVLVNCSAGKDRTGVVIAIVLWAMGVKRDLIVEDYALTERLHDPAAPLFLDDAPAYAYLAEVPRDVWFMTMRSAPAYIDAMFDEIETRHESVDTFLRDVANVSPEKIEAVRGMCVISVKE